MAQWIRLGIGSGLPVVYTNTANLLDENQAGRLDPNRVGAVCEQNLAKIIEMTRAD